MKTFPKKSISFFLIFIMLFSFGMLSYAEAQYEVGDVITFGSYPQSLVKNADELKKLNEIFACEAFDENWISFGYWYGTDPTGNNDLNNSAGTQAKYDYMFYADVISGGAKYRAVKFSLYRPKITDYPPTEGNGNQYANGFFTDTVYWFRYEPIKWKMLDPESGFVISEAVLDCQAFNPMGAVESTDSFTPDIIDYLNKDFYNTAFSDLCKAEIKTDSYGNKLSLATADMLKNTAYGFETTKNSSSARIAYPTDYASCSGADSVSDSPCIYWTGTAASTSKAQTITKSGALGSLSFICNHGVRPVMYLNTEAAGKHNLSFYDGEKLISEEILRAGATITAPQAEKKTGYTFVGWGASVPETMPDNDLVFSAERQLNKHKVSFFADGGKFVSGKEISEDDCFYGLPFTVPTPSKQGYDFAGWDKAIPEIMPDKPLEFTALWTPCETTPYTVKTFKQNADDSGYETVSVTMYGKTGTAVSVTPEFFDGFYFDESKSTPGGIILPDGSAVFELYYGRNIHTATFDYGDKQEQKSFYFGQKIAFPTSPEKEGFTFTGWGSNTEIMPDKDISFTAQWKINTYTASFIADGKETDFEVPFGAVIPLPDEPEKEGYIFAGWNIPVPEAMPAGNISFRADFRKCSVKILGLSEKFVGYKAQITFHALTENTDGTELIWYVDGKEYARGETCVVKAPTASYNICLKAVRNGKEICTSESEKVNVRNGFFDIILSFFGRLFKMSRYFIDQK